MDPRDLPVLDDREPPELLVHDGIEECSYLEGRKARMPLRLPTRVLRPEEVDARFERGDRRHGAFLYRPSCPGCSACEAIRIDVERFTFGRTQRRILRRGDKLVRTSFATPEATPERIALYNKHKNGRELWSKSEQPIDLLRYHRFLVDRCCQAFELQYRIDGALVGVAITDRGASALSAVYCYYDPAHAKLSLGTYSILKQIELCRRWGLRHLYLGLYVDGNAQMAYKARFFPHERRIDGAWREFTAPSSAPK